MSTFLDSRILSSPFVQTVSTFWPQILLLETEGGENLLVYHENSVQSFESARGLNLPLPLQIPTITLAAVDAKLLSERVKTTGRQSIAGSVGLADLAPLTQQRGCY